MIQIDLFSLFLQIVSVAVLMKVLDRVVIGPILGVIEERETSILNDQTSAESLAAEAEIRRTELAAKQNSVREQVKRHQADIREATNAKAREMHQAAVKRTDADVEKALASLHGEINEARPALERQAGELAELMERNLLA